MEKTITANGKEYVGVPHIDFLTFGKWRAIGKRVKKGEKSCYKSVSFPKSTDKDGNEKSFPRVYNLFHRSQVE